LCAWWAPLEVQGRSACTGITWDVWTFLCAPDRAGWVADLSAFLTEH